MTPPKGASSPDLGRVEALAQQQINATAKRLDHPKHSIAVYPASFREWEQLMREPPCCGRCAA